MTTCRLFQLSVCSSELKAYAFCWSRYISMAAVMERASGVGAERSQRSPAFSIAFLVAGPKQARRVLPCLKLGKFFSKDSTPAGVKNTSMSKSKGCSLGVFVAYCAVHYAFGMFQLFGVEHFGHIIVCVHPKGAPGNFRLCAWP